MLNEKVMSVFDAVMHYLTPGDFVVIPKENILNELGGSYEQTDIDSALNALQMNELVQIKYADKSVYCLTVMPKGIREDEYRESLREEERKRAEMLAAEEAETQRKAVLDEEVSKINEEVEPEEETNELEIVESKEVAKNTTIDKKTFVKMGLICGLSGFFGAFLAGMITFIIFVTML